MKSLSKYLLRFGMAVAAVALMSGAAQAGTYAYGNNNYSNLPAVSGLNGSADIRGGAAQGNVTGMMSGEVSAPITHSLGVQFDGALGTIGGDTAKSVGAHLFYRNPSQALLGGTYQRGWYEGLHYNRFGLEGEYYYGMFTPAARIGYQNGTIHHGEYSNLDLGWYLNDNLVVTPGFRNIVGQAWGRVATEWKPRLFTVAPGLSGFASVGAGNDGYAFGMLGIRYYFGDDKTLIRHHREDDPQEMGPDELMENYSKFKPAGPSAPPPT